MAVKVLKENDSNKEAVIAYYEEHKKDITDIKNLFVSFAGLTCDNGLIGAIVYDLDNYNYPIGTNFRVMYEELEKLYDTLKGFTAVNIRAVMKSVNKIFPKE